MSMVVNHLLHPGMILQVVVLVKIIYNQLVASAKLPHQNFWVERPWPNVATGESIQHG